MIRFLVRRAQPVGVRGLVLALGLAVSTSPALGDATGSGIKFSDIAKKIEGPINIVVVGDSYSQNAQRWTGPFAEALAETYGRAVGGWVSYGFVAKENGEFGESSEPIGRDMSAFRDNWVQVHGNWFSDYRKTKCPDMSGVMTYVPGDRIVRGLPERAIART